MSNQCDLQATSIDATPTSVRVGKKTKMTAVLDNLGPGTIPIGGAICQITISKMWFYKPTNFKTYGGEQWSLLGIKGDKNFYVLFCQNNAGEIPPTTGYLNYGFTFSLKGKKKTPKGVPADITLISSLSLDATSSDIQGENQFASMKIQVL